MTRHVKIGSVNASAALSRRQVMLGSAGLSFAVALGVATGCRRRARGDTWRQEQSARG